MNEFLARLTWVDWAVALGILRGCWVGYRSGFLPELLRLAALFVSTIATFRFYEEAAEFLTLKSFLNLPTAQAVSFVALFLGFFLAAKFLVFVLLKVFKLGEGGFLYRLLGLFLGAGRWVILMSFFFLLVEVLPASSLRMDIHERSVCGAGVAKVAPLLLDFFSKLSPQLGVETAPGGP